MKRFVMLAAILATLIASTTPLQAARRRTTSTYGSRQGTVYTPQRTGFFARLMEMERRKNAAIRRMMGRE